MGQYAFASRKQTIFNYDVNHSIPNGVLFHTTYITHNDYNKNLATKVCNVSSIKNRQSWQLQRSGFYLRPLPKQLISQNVIDNGSEICRFARLFWKPYFIVKAHGSTSETSQHQKHMSALHVLCIFLVIYSAFCYNILHN